MVKNSRIDISAGAFLWPAVLLLLLPLQWVFAMLFAGAFHEFCHIAAIRLTGGKVLRIRIGARGAVIETGELPPWQELLCALAGPMGSAFLLLTAKWFPRLAICGCVHFLYNLLPLFPFDGGRILKSLLSLFLKPDADVKAWEYSQYILRGCILALGVLAAVKYGWMLLLPGIVLIHGIRKEKSLANRPFWRYNRGTNAKGYQYDRTEAEDPPQRTEAGALHRWRVP